MKWKRKDRSSSPTPPKPGKDKTAPPQRIDVASSTLSLREQLSLIKQDAEGLEGAASRGRLPLVRTKFRRKKAEASARRRPRNDDADIPGGKYDLGVQPLIFIDGYNVIGAWPRLRKKRDRTDLEGARASLLTDVTEFSAVRGWECVVVFDALHAAVVQERKEEENGVSVVFTGNETADTYIERSVFQHCKRQERQVWAATSDSLHGRVSSGMGAHIMSASLFIQELKRVRRETKEKVEEQNNGGNAYSSKMLQSTVDKATLKELYRLRDELGQRR